MPSAATLTERLALSLLYQRYRAVCARLDAIDRTELEGPLTARLDALRTTLREELWRLTEQMISDSAGGGE